MPWTVNIRRRAFLADMGLGFTGLVLAFPRSMYHSECEDLE